MKVNLHTPIEEVQIQIVPLIDVIFCILTFFLLAALQFTRQQAINVDLPKASTGTSSAVSSPSGSDILPVTIDAVGQTYIEKDAVRREDLVQKLRQYIQANPNGVVVLNASRTASYNDVIETLDLLREVGGNRVSLGIIPGPPQPTTNSPSLPTAPSEPSLNAPNLPNNPSLPINPGTAPLPNTAPVPGINPQGNFSPYFPSAPNQVPATGQGINPGNPGIPNAPAPQMPVAPGTTNNNPPQR